MKAIMEIAERWVNTTEITAKERMARNLAITATQQTNHHYDGREYIVHLAHVRDVAERYKNIIPIPMEEQEDIFCSCWGHDLIEDNRLTWNDIQKIMGEKIANIIFCLTDEKGRTTAERQNAKFYSELLAHKWAPYVKLFDRLANIEYGRFYQSDPSVVKNLDRYRKSFPKMEKCYQDAGLIAAEPIMRDIKKLLLIQ